MISSYSTFGGVKIAAIILSRLTLWLIFLTCPGTKHFESTDRQKQKNFIKHCSIERTHKKKSPYVVLTSTHTTNVCLYHPIMTFWFMYFEKNTNCMQCYMCVIQYNETEINQDFESQTTLWVTYDTQTINSKKRQNPTEILDTVATGSEKKGLTLNNKKNRTTVVSRKNNPP